MRKTEDKVDEKVKFSELLLISLLTLLLHFINSQVSILFNAIPPILAMPFSPTILRDASKSLGLAAVVISMVDKPLFFKLIIATVVSSASNLLIWFEFMEQSLSTGPKSQFNASI